MLRYYYIETRDRLYVNDYKSGFFGQFDQSAKQWVIPTCSFMQVEHDFDTDFVEISKEAAMKISNGVTVDEDFKAYLSMFARVK